MANLVNAEQIAISFGTTTVLFRVSLGIAAGEVIGVVGRNGSGKTTLLRLLTGAEQPDAGRITRTGRVSVGYLHQADDFAPGTVVRDVIAAGRSDHVWAADPWTRGVVQHLLAEVDLDTGVARLSGGERRRVALVGLMLAGHDLLVLDEPTNHLDVEAVNWLANQLRALTERGTAMLVVSHDRWFLDAVCTRVWEVHDGQVDAYDGGYAAYVLARAERARQAVGTAARRRNLLRKELAWLRRGPPARTSKPKFRTEAAAALIADEPPPRDSLALRRFAITRLGKDVFDLSEVTLAVGDRTLVRDLSWSIGPGDRIGLVGVNGTGKTSLLRALTGDFGPVRGRVKPGRTLVVGHLSQEVSELPGDERVLEFVDRVRRVTRLASGQDMTAGALLEDFGFTGDRLTTRIGELSGGERRRLQLLRILLDEPNVLLLDEPTNDLDIDTLTVVEDYLDSWPGTLIVVSHDRYFLERVCDVTYALLGDGSCVLLPGGVEEYLARRAANQPAERANPPVPAKPAQNAIVRQARKDLNRIESQLARLDTEISRLHEQMAAAARDHVQLGELQSVLEAAEARKAALEESWLTAAEHL